MVKSTLNKIYLVFTLIFVVIFGTLIFITQRRTSEIISTITLDQVQSAKKNLINYIDELGSRSLQRTMLLTNRHSFIEAVKDNDYQTIQNYLNEYSEDFDFMFLCDSNGIVSARSYSDKRGDDLSWHENIAAILRGEPVKNPLSFSLDGEFGLGTSVPVYSDNNLIGVVTSVFTLTKNEYVDVFKEQTGCEATVFVGTKLVATTLMDRSGNRFIGVEAEKVIIESIFERGEEFYTGYMNIADKTYGTHYSPLKSGDKIIGMLATATDIHSVIEIRKSINRLIFFAILFGIAVSMILIIAYGKYSSTLKKLSERTASFDNLQILLQSMDTMIIITDIKTDKIIFMNERMKDELGLTDAVIGEKCWKFFTLNTNERCDFCPKNDSELNDGKPVSWEYHNPINSRYYRIRSRFIDWPDGSKVFIEQCDDITELKDLIEKLREADMAKSKFLATMSHEIRTPMNSIVGFSELAQDDKIPQKTREYIDKIKGSANWLLHIINDILDISKIESGKTNFENIPFDLHIIFEHCKSAMMPKAIEKGLELHFYAEPSIQKKLLGDPVKLSQVLVNLLSNAVKFTNTGTIKFSATVIKSGGNSLTICFEIKDTGIGMSPEQMANIFEPFAQADNSITRIYGGTGLGLTIAKNFIEIMGGILKVESEPGAGSKFSFELTFETVDEADIPNWNLPIDEHEKPNFEGEVLIFEDNLMNQQVICEHLARVGLKTVIANDGREGVDIVAERIQNGQKPFDLIFIDIQMPVMDGLEAASKIINMGIKTPLVAMTANIMSSELELYKRNGMSDFLGKPFTSQELWKCLMKYLPVTNFSVVEKKEQNDLDEEFKNYLKAHFVKNNQTKFAEFKKALEEDIQLAHRIAHTLKGNAGQIGEKRLQEAAKTVEKTLKGGENLLSEEQINTMETELKAVLERLAREEHQ
jgi:signal transduction histidine kinase/DNA-binding response OmpR family regulator